MRFIHLPQLNKDCQPSFGGARTFDLPVWLGLEHLAMQNHVDLIFDGVLNWLLMYNVKMSHALFMFWFKLRPLTTMPKQPGQTFALERSLRSDTVNLWSTTGFDNLFILEIFSRLLCELVFADVVVCQHVSTIPTTLSTTSLACTSSMCVAPHKP